MALLRSFSPALITCLLVIPGFHGEGCGPFFTENFLDQPRAILRPPVFDFIGEFRKLKHPPIPGVKTSRPMGAPAYTLSQEMEEMETVMAGRMPDATARKAWLADYRTLRAAMLQVSDKSEFNMESKDALQASTGLIRAGKRQWPQGLPEDVKLYLEGAQSFAEKDLEAARASWKKLLDLPAAERHWRSTWAAWMLFRSSSGDMDEERHWLEETRKLAGEKFADCLNLGIEATYLLPRVSGAGSEPVKMAEWGHAACARTVLGHTQSAKQLATDASGLRTVTDAEADSIMADPYLRRVALLSLLEHRPATAFFGDFDAPETVAPEPWLERFEKLNVREQPEATLLAWVAYQRADFNAAGRWLKIAPATDTKALWLRGKMAAMRGDTTEAERLHKLAAKPALAQPFDDARADMERTRDHSLEYLTPDNYDGVQRNHLLASLGATHLANNHFMDALRAFERSDYWLDTAYIVERLIPLEDLLVYARKRFPKEELLPVKPAPPKNATEPATEPAEQPTGLKALRRDYDWGYGDESDENTHGNRFRYLVARRLAREHFFKDARELFPKVFLPPFDHYVAAWRRGHDERLPKAQRAVALWDAAQMHRALGLELFGYEGAPDFATYAGEFEREDPTVFRARGTWLYRWDEEDATPKEREQARPVLPASREELKLAAANLPKINIRFHYRYVAAEIAWQAAALMPDNDQRTGEVLCIAGSWLQRLDPKAADRFYQALVRRCAGIPLGQEADKKRWFPVVAWSYNPKLEATR